MKNQVIMDKMVENVNEGDVHPWHVWGVRQIENTSYVTSDFD